MSRSFLLVLLQRIEAESLYTKPLLAAFQEVEKLFTRAFPGEVRFTKIYLAPSLPTDDLRRQPRIDWGRTEQLLRTDEWWGAPRRRVQTVDQEKLAPKIRSLVKATSDEILVAAVNANITPPEGWGYALWDIVDAKNAVIGLNPMSPQYWGIQSSDRMDRVRAVTSRLRASACAVVGRQMGLEPCANPGCFLFDPVTSVEQLDQMRDLGPEHPTSAKFGRVAVADADEPDEVDEADAPDDAAPELEDVL